MPILNKCCWCGSLRTGTIVCGVLGIIFSVTSFIILLATKAKIKTIVLDDLSPLLVKIIISLDLIMTFVISILLIIGAVKRRVWFLIPWIFIAIILAIGTAISVIYTSVEFYLKDDVASGTACIIIGLIIVSIQIYLWIVVLSFYQSIEEEKNSRGR